MADNDKVWHTWKEKLEKMLRSTKFSLEKFKKVYLGKHNIDAEKATKFVTSPNEGGTTILGELIKLVSTGRIRNCNLVTWGTITYNNDKWVTRKSTIFCCMHIFFMHSIRPTIEKIRIFGKKQIAPDKHCIE
jgi:hypothetical protein